MTKAYTHPGPVTRRNPLEKTKMIHRHTDINGYMLTIRHRDAETQRRGDTTFVKCWLHAPFIGPQSNW